jgi:MFS family permease
MASPRAALLLLGIIYLGFVSLGLPDGTLGVAWPGISRELQLAIGLAGVVTTVITLLSAVSGFASGAIVARFRTGPVVCVSCVLTGSALLVISQARGFPWLLAAAVPLGLGAGAVDASLNGYVAKHYSGRQMNWLHACWGLGATCGPLVMGFTMGAAAGWRGGYLILGSAQLILAMVFLATLRLWSLVPEHAPEHGGNHPGPAAPALSASSFAGWLSPALIAVYVALEAAVGLWSATILTLERGFTAGEAAACTAGYYGAIMGGRIVAGLVVERLGNRRVIALGLGVALAGAAVFTLARTPWSAAMALGLVGAGFAPVYPGLMHEVPRRFAPSAAQTVIGRQSGAAYLGMAIVPAALGWLAELSLDGIPWVVLGGIVLLFSGIRQLNRMT